MLKVPLRLQITGQFNHLCRLDFPSLSLVCSHVSEGENTQQRRENRERWEEEQRDKRDEMVGGW